MLPFQKNIDVINLGGALTTSLADVTSCYHTNVMQLHAVCLARV